MNPALWLWRVGYSLLHWWLRRDHVMPDMKHTPCLSGWGFATHAAWHVTGTLVTCPMPQLGLAAEFHSEKIPRNRLGTASIIPRKKALIPRHSEVHGRVYSEAQHGRKWHEKISCTKILLQQTELTACFPPRHSSDGVLVFFRRMVRNRIPSVCLYFCSTERNSELFSFPRNGSEWNSERLLQIFFHGTEFRAFSRLWNGSEQNSENFLFRGTGIPPEETNCSVYSVFRGIIFWSEITNHIATADNSEHLYIYPSAVQSCTGGSYVEKPAKTKTIYQIINNHRSAKNVYVYTNLPSFDFLGLKVYSLVLSFTFYITFYI